MGDANDGCSWRIDTPIGPLTAVWGRHGLRALRFGARRGARAVAAASAPAPVRELAARLRAHLSGRPRGFGDVPIDVQGTAFSRRVYAALRRIPPGRTRSYGEVARAVGRPGAARAVGAALARNPVPVVVPCHRVVGASGALTGFSAPGGLRLKRRLLAIEAGSGR